MVFIPNRISEQHVMEHKMFGSKRKNIRLGKMFRRKGKGIVKKMKPLKSMKSKGISPSIEQFDKMMKSISGKSNKKKTFSSQIDDMEV